MKPEENNMRQIPRMRDNRMVDCGLGDYRFGATIEDFMLMVNGLIQYVTGGFDSEDFADTVFVYDEWRAGENPADTAERIMNGDDIAENYGHRGGQPSRRVHHVGRGTRVGPTREWHSTCQCLPYGAGVTL
jgi:hypothetical protein